ncbi:MAG TPA: hypothetical protein VNU71_03115 [Burkholderiaceae bacterium]|nr:hypothetical protein [Burkholderiaceae bacterium]
MQLLNTLYVTLPDSRLRLDNDTLRAEVGSGEERETRLRVPLHHLQAVVCFGGRAPQGRARLSGPAAWPRST